MPIVDFKSSHSEIDTFRKCPRAHFYSYGLKIQPNRPGKQLVRGVIGHNALAAYYRAVQKGESHFEAKTAAFAVVGTQLEELDFFYDKDALRIELGMSLRDYFDWVEPEFGEIEVLGVEEEFTAILDGETSDDPDFSLPFIVDLIVRHPKYGIEAWDHKFVWDFYNPNLVDLSPQLPLYYAGLRMLGHSKYIGVRYNEIRYQTTLEIKANRFARFNRPDVRMTPQRVEATLKDHLKLSRLVKNLKSMSMDEWESWTWRAANNQACKNCDFSKICIGELNGESRDLYIGVDYKPRERRNR